MKLVKMFCFLAYECKDGEENEERGHGEARGSAARCDPVNRALLLALRGTLAATLCDAGEGVLADAGVAADGGEVGRVARELGGQTCAVVRTVSPGGTDLSFRTAQVVTGGSTGTLGTATLSSGAGCTG